MAVTYHINIGNLLLEELALEVLLEYHGLYHDEAIPKLNARECHLRVGVFDGIYENLEVEPTFIGFDDQVWLLGEYFSDAQEAAKHYFFPLIRYYLEYHL